MEINSIFSPKNYIESSFECFPDFKHCTLLVCFENRRKIQIPINFLYSLFNNYGKVLKITIIEKNEIWKVLVEMDSKENAKNAIEKLNLNPIFSDGSRLYVDFSPPDFLSINETHESKDSNDFENPTKLDLRLNRANTYQIDYKPIRKDSLSKKENLSNPLTLLKKSKTLDFEEIEYNLNEEKTKNKKKSNFGLDSLTTLSNISASCFSKKENLKSNQSTIQKIDSNFNNNNSDIFLEFLRDFKIKIPNSKNNTPKKNEFNEFNFKNCLFGNLYQKNLVQNQSPFNLQNILGMNQINYPMNLNTNYNQMIFPFNKQNTIKNNFNFVKGIIDNAISKVLYIKGISQFVNSKMIYNLFSNFGNILKILLLKQKECCFVEYENFEFASISKELLNNMMFYQKQMRIYFSNYPELNIHGKQFLPNEEILICTPKMYRFKQGNTLSINPPSNVLHVSNLKLEICCEEKIFEIFKQFGKIEKIKFLFMDKKNMCLIRYKNIEDSFFAIANLHDKEIYGRILKISFTKSKI